MLFLCILFVEIQAQNTTLGDWITFNNYSQEIKLEKYQNHNYTSHYGTPNGTNNTKGLIINADANKYAYVTTSSCPLFHFEPPFVNEEQTTNLSLVLSMTQRCINLVNDSDFQRNKTTSLKLDFMNLAEVESQLKNENTTLYTCLVSEIYPSEGYPGSNFCCCPRIPIFEVDDDAVLAMVLVPLLLFLTLIIGICVCVNLDTSPIKYEFE